MCFTAFPFLVFLILIGCEGKSYRNHALLRGVPYDFGDLKFFESLARVYNATFWKRPTLVNNAVEFSISPANLANLHRDADNLNIRLTTVARDIQSAFDRQMIRTYSRRNLQSFNWQSYYRLDDIYDWLRDLGETHPNEVRVRSIGKSYENRTILSVKLTLKGSIRRSKVIVEGGCHGHQWISPAFVTYMIHTLLNAKKYNNEQLQRIALMYSWIFVPVMNPDGYEYTYTTDRLWRKNRRGGYGVDLNRNFGFNFGAHCPDRRDVVSREYCGTRPFSEPESHAMSLFTKDNSDNLEYYLSFHSYGQHIVLPYSNTKEHKDNYYIVKKMSDEVANLILEKHGIKFTIGNNYEVLGSLVSGKSTDWVKRALKVSYVATFVLPDTGVHGFALPQERILPTCQATMDGLLVVLDPQTEQILRTADGAIRENRVFVGTVFVCNVFLNILYRLNVSM